MNQWIMPAAALAVVVAATAGLSAVPLAQPPVRLAPAPDARVSVVCPAQSTPNITQRLGAVASGGPVRVGALAADEGKDQPSLLTVVDALAEPSRVSAPRDDDFGAITWLTAPDTSDRGMGASGCAMPTTSQWFTGAELTPTTQAEIVLANLDATDAAAAITVWTKDGLQRAPGLGAVKVLAGQTSTVPLNIQLTSDAPVALRVASSSGRLVAYLRQRLWQGAQPRGADWIPSGPAPARGLVVPGVPSGPGRRDLVIVNPGAKDAVVSVTMLGENGPVVPAGLDAIVVPAESTLTTDVAPSLAEQPGTLEITSTTDVTAGVILSTDGSDDQTDPAFITAGTPLGPDGLWPFPVAKSTRLELQLTNPSAAPAVATVTSASAPGKDEKVTQVEVPPETSLRVRMPSLAVAVVRVQTPSKELYGAMIATGKVGTINGLAVVGMSGALARTSVPAVEYDPHAGT